MSCGRQAVRSCVLTDFPIDTSCIQIGSCTQNHCPAREYRIRTGSHSAYSAILRQNLADLSLPDGQIPGILKNSSHLPAILLLICLRPQRMYRGSLRQVQHLRLNIGFIYILPHLSAEGINFPHQVSFGSPSDIRIAGHQRNTVHTDCEQ